MRRTTSREADVGRQRGCGWLLHEDVGSRRERGRRDPLVGVDRSRDDDQVGSLDVEELGRISRTTGRRSGVASSVVGGRTSLDAGQLHQRRAPAAGGFGRGGSSAIPVGPDQGHARWTRHRCPSEADDVGPPAARRWRPLRRRPRRWCGTRPRRCGDREVPAATGKGEHTAPEQLHGQRVVPRPVSGQEARRTSATPAAPGRHWTTGPTWWAVPTAPCRAKASRSPWASSPPRCSNAA